MLSIKRGLAVIAIFITFVVATAPAAIVYWLVPGQAGISLGYASGTLWSGKIDKLVYKGVSAGPLRWQLQPWSLFGGEVSANVQLGKRGSDIRGQGVVGWSNAGAFSDGLELRLPAELLDQVFRLPMGIKTSGQLTLALNEARQGAPWCQSLDGHFVVEQGLVASRFARVPIDRLEMDLACLEGDLSMVLVPETNSLGLDVTAILGDKKRISLNGYIDNSPAQPKELRPLLKFLGKPDASGRFPLKYNGPVPGL